MKKVFFLVAVFCAALMTSCKDINALQCWEITWENKLTCLTGTYYFWGTGSESDKELDRVGSMMGKATKKQTNKDKADCISDNIPNLQD